jgi:hypothetical protein
MLALIIALISGTLIFRSISKPRSIALLICLPVLLNIYLVGHLNGYPKEQSSYRVDAKLLTAIIFIESHQSKYKQLPEQNVLNQWISQVHPQQSITYTNKKPAKALHKKVWGKDEADYIVGTFNGDGMQFYSSWQNRFYYAE